MNKLLLLAFVFLPTFAFAQMPDFPMTFWGDATIDGIVAPTGATIRVYAGSVEVGQVVLQESGVYGYTESTKQKLVVGESDGTLTFTVQATSINGGVETQGISPVTHAGFISGETIEKDLAFITKTSSGGGGSGGGGNSGSNKKKIATPTELVVAVSTTTPISTLSGEERKIELQKQLIQLLTQLIVLLKLKLSLVPLT